MLCSFTKSLTTLISNVFECSSWPSIAYGEPRPRLTGPSHQAQPVDCDVRCAVPIIVHAVNWLMAESRLAASLVESCLTPLGSSVVKSMAGPGCRHRSVETALQSGEKPTPMHLSCVTRRQSAPVYALNEHVVAVSSNLEIDGNHHSCTTRQPMHHRNWIRWRLAVTCTDQHYER